MQHKKYDFTLPRTITKKQWRIIHRDMRVKLRDRGGDGVRLISEKYGTRSIYTVGNHSKILFFWNLTSHKEYDRSFLADAIRCNTQGRTIDRVCGTVMALKDPAHPINKLQNMGGGK